ncbi:hypothetical protein L226DRAFT_465268 [Lentinus tigrinus ALCF2SS1-7]|uniref:MYND-type domain-containing protein n=1 Tax=Lentinus tigrinus ALCF2SS1-6 TaxID=1328759 RepID=A0A5C2S5Z6_9APHY|nr:hypothetical protein L227DRAFT_549599 [Lentinus tigrinus ALCF2SS1-6]RPD73558.1 hypothetical protein L226DRAFT_465268 [Lentinus tigrinus ALCF2SS1-7]
MSTHDSRANLGDSLRRCHKCGRAPEEGERLRRCSGCFHVLYCSKTCQKDDWKRHKPVCQTNGSITLSYTRWNDQLQNLGYENLSAFSESMGQWMDAHNWALQACVDVDVIQAGGIDKFQNPQMLARLHLVPRASHLPTTRNPSLMFQLRKRSPITLNEQFVQSSGYREDWERGAPVRASLRDQYKTDPLFAGLVPMLVSVEGLDMTQFIYRPQFRTDPVFIPVAEELEPMRDVVLADILKLAVASVNQNFPLRKLINHPLAFTLPGRFVRSQGAWTWQQLFSEWEQYRHGQSRGLDETLPLLQSGIPPKELLFIWKSLAL